MRAKSMLTKSLLRLLFFLLMGVYPAAAGKIIYVDDDGPADFNTFQAAIDDANDGDTVLVAPGTYTGNSNRDIDFRGKAITVKSEDGPQTCIIDCQGTEDDPHRGFYFHSGEDASSILQGFTVTNGYIHQDGGAIYCNMSSPSIINCIISDNKAIRARAKGGGIALIESEAYIISCVVRNNIAQGGDGGGIYISNNGGQIPRITRCIISGNTAITAPRFGGEGGGVALSGNGYLLNCVITGNRAGYWGGGISCRMPHHQGFLSNSIVWANICPRKSSASQLTMPTCNYDGVFAITIENSVIADSNGNDGIYILSDNSNCITGSWLTTNPLFIQPGYWDIVGTPDYLFSLGDDIWIDGDYHLKSQAGRFDPSSGSLMVDQVTSPCIDAGDPNMPVGDEPEPNGGRINMGAYGGTPEASKSYILSKIIYVDDDAVGLNDGSSWQNAYTFLQDALADAKLAEKPVEIRVAQGIYKPDQGIGIILGDWRASFHLKNGVTIKGGYAGLSAQDPNARNVGEYETILSGDLNGNDVYVNDPYDLLNERTRAENSWTVVECSNTDLTAVLDGVTITGGDFTVITFGLGGDPVGGAGMLISSGSPTLINCTFTDNVTNNVGGGLLIYDGSNPTLLNCKFIRNYAESGGGGIFSSESGPTLINCTFCNNYARRKGGAMFNFRSNPELTNCTFSGNSIPDIPTGLNEGGGAMRNSDSNLVLNKCVLSENTASYGAGMYNENNSSLTLKNCIFRNNLAGISGGGMFTEDSNDLRLIDCFFSGNSAKHSGGGMANKYSNVILINCIFSGNKAFDELRTYPSDIFPSEGGGLYTFGNIKLINCTNCTFTGNWAQQGRAIAKSGTSDFRLTNCILWDGGNEIFDIIPNRITFDTSYSNIQNVLEGKRNINEDPLFADPGYWADTDDPNIVVEPNDPNAVWVDGDYHLKSQAGRWEPVSESWIIDDVTSPCIDAGDPNSPIGHESFPNGWIINMGAYGGTPEASKSISAINSRF